jgi:uncharacterized phage-associated protein
MPHASVEIANEFLRLAGGRLTQMQVQKLAYIAHGWNLAINGEPLIAEPPRAWPYGPVYVDLYEHTKLFGKDFIGRLVTPDDSMPARFFGSSGNARPYEARLTPSQREIIRQVWQRYGSLSAIRLSELTHQPNTPWYNAFRRGQGAELPNEEIRVHYLELAQRASSAAH